MILPAVDLVPWAGFNPELNKPRFGAIGQPINRVTTLSIMFTGRGADPHTRAWHYRASASDAELLSSR